MEVDVQAHWICLINVFWYLFSAFPHENATGSFIFQYLGSYKCLKEFRSFGYYIPSAVQNPSMVYEFCEQLCCYSWHVGHTVN